MRRSIVLLAAALLLSGCSLARDLQATHCPPGRRLLPSGSADYLDFVVVAGTTYYAGYRPTAGRPLRGSDLGAPVAAVRCKLAGRVVEGPDRQLDGDATYLDPGTHLHAVNGYRPSFRLAARRDGRLILFEAAENPNARTWADLLDLHGKVRRIAVRDRNGRPLAAIADRPQVQRLVRQLLDTPWVPAQACADHGNVLLAFHLDDGTATTLGYHVPSRRLDCREPLSRSFGAAIRAALR